MFGLPDGALIHELELYLQKLACSLLSDNNAGI